MINDHYLITGGTSGIGGALTERLVEDGMRVSLLVRSTDRVKPDHLDNDGSHAVVCDLRRPQEVESAVAAVVKNYGCPGTVINSAGVAPLGPFAQMKSGALHDLFAVNVLAPMTLTASLVEPMIGLGGGTICLLGSTVTYQATGPRLMAAYITTKSALAAFNLAMYTELSRFGIRCRLATIGACRTRMWDGLQGAARQRPTDNSPYAVDYEYMDATIGQAWPIPSAIEVADQVLAEIRSPTDPDAPEFFVPRALSKPLRTVEGMVDGVDRARLAATRTPEDFANLVHAVINR